MKYFLIFLYCFPLVVFSQEKNTPQNLTDSVKVKKKIRFLDPGWKKHNHIVDFTGLIGFIYFEPVGGALGYRYLYSTDWKWNVKFGARVGVWYRKTGDDIPANSARESFLYSGSIIVNAPIWKPFNFETSFGFRNSISWPAKTNTFDTKDIYYGYPFWFLRTGINMIFFNHLTIDFGAEFTFDYLPKNWYQYAYLTLGIKF